MKLKFGKCFDGKDKYSAVVRSSSNAGVNINTVSLKPRIGVNENNLQRIMNQSGDPNVRH